MRVLTCLSLCGLLAIVGCSKDKNLKDYNQELAQQFASQIEASSGSFAGSAISKLDNTNLGAVTLNFNGQYIQSSSSQDQQTVRVSGTLNLKSLTSAEIVFNNGTYNDTNKKLQVIIPVTVGNDKRNLTIEGIVDGDQWRGAVFVDGYPELGATLNLVKNAPVPNTSAIEVGGTRLQQIKKMSYLFSGTYVSDGREYPVKMRFMDSDISPEQKFYKLFSPVRTVNLNFDFTGFDYNFVNANFDDKAGTIDSFIPSSQPGTYSSLLTCKKFDESNGDFGWDCTTKVNGKVHELHLLAQKTAPR